MLQSSKLLSVFKPDTLSGVLTLFNDHNLSYSRTGSEDAVVNNITLTRVYQLKYLGYLKLIGSGYNWCHWSPIRWDPCGALNLDVQDVYANGCTVNGTVHLQQPVRKQKASIIFCLVWDGTLILHTSHQSKIFHSLIFYIFLRVLVLLLLFTQVINHLKKYGRKVKSKDVTWKVEHSCSIAFSTYGLFYWFGCLMRRGMMRL